MTTVTTIHGNHVIYDAVQLWENEQTATRLQPCTTTIIGHEIRIIADTDSPSRHVSIVGRQRILARRANGALYRYWVRTVSAGLRVTKDGLPFLAYQLHTDSGFEQSSTYLFSSDTSETNISTGADIRRLFRYAMPNLNRPTPLAESSTIAVKNCRIIDENTPLTADRVEEGLLETLDAVVAHLGPIPQQREVYPLLPDVSTNRLSGMMLSYMRQADNWAEVAKNAFGKTRYSRPLANLCEQLPGRLPLYTLFRGLVPMDWIINALRTEVNTSEHLAMTPLHGRLTRFTSRLSSRHHRILRPLLKGVPQSVLRRMLKENPIELDHILMDIASLIQTHKVVKRSVEDILAGVRARGARNIRSTRDLEQIVLAAPTEHTPIRRRAAATANVIAREKQTLRLIKEYVETVELLQHEDPARWAHLVLPDESQRTSAAFAEQAEVVLEQLRAERTTDYQREQAARAEERRQQQLIEEAERVAWCAETTAHLRDLTLPGNHELIIAHTPQELNEWGQYMGNCIGGYGHRLGLDILMAIYDAQGQMILNIQIAQKGMCQYLGKRNTDAHKTIGNEAARTLLRSLLSVEGVTLQDYVTGLSRALRSSVTD